MGITRAQVNSLEALATWLNANTTLFKAVSYADDVMTATDADDNVVWEVKGTRNGSDLAYFRAYREENNYIGVNLNLFPNTQSVPVSIIACDNGVIIDCSVSDTNGYGRQFAFLLAKTNNDKVAIVFEASISGTTNECYYKGLNHVAWGDSTTMSTTTTFTPETGQQTIMCTFGTNADITDVSYTPKAFYMPMHSAYNSGIGKFLCGGKVYITNGYWCIDTEEDAE